MHHTQLDTPALRSTNVSWRRILKTCRGLYREMKSGCVRIRRRTKCLHLPKCRSRPAQKASLLRKWGDAEMRERYICTRCGLVHEITLSRWKCDCGGLLDLDFDRKDTDPAAWPKYPVSIFRYAETMPLEHADWRMVTMGEGQT